MQNVAECDKLMQNASLKGVNCSNSAISVMYTNISIVYAPHFINAIMRI